MNAHVASGASAIIAEKTYAGVLGKLIGFLIEEGTVPALSLSITRE
jgi:hypothetical protein